MTDSRGPLAEADGRIDGELTWILGQSLTGDLALGGIDARVAARGSTPGAPTHRGAGTENGDAGVTTGLNV